MDPPLRWPKCFYIFEVDKDQTRMVWKLDLAYVQQFEKA